LGTAADQAQLQHQWRLSPVQKAELSRSEAGITCERSAPTMRKQTLDSGWG